MGTSQSLRSMAAELLRLADRLDGKGGDRPPKPDQLLTTAAASRKFGRSYSALYRDARKHGVGWQIPSGEWRFSEQKLRIFFARPKSGEDGEVGDADRIVLASGMSDVRYE